MKLRLFDLEWRKYELRRSVINAKIDAHLKQNNSDKDSDEAVKVFLEPPSPPRLKFTEDERPVKGNRYANVGIAIFCSYQSSHCARLQPVLHELEQRYADQINFRFYDLPQRFHRYAKSAANAVYCATEFGAPWEFQSAIYADINQLNQERYLVIAEQLGFEQAAFSACLTERRYKDLIEADIKLGQQFGLGNVPVLFINGLYVKGPQTADGFVYYIDKELTRLADIKPKLSTLPIQLLATSVSNKVEESTAILKYRETGNIHTYKTGDMLSDKLKLVSIEEARILIDHLGQLEFILLKNSYDVQASSHEIISSTEKQELTAADIKAAKTEEPPKQYRQLKPTGDMRLSREWLEEQLQRQEELEVFFYAAEHEVDGVHLLKLNDIENQDFYKTLGLRSGDVILRVNEQFVHDSHNPLWETLQNEEAVKLLIMRKGFPVRYDYKIK